MTDTDFAGVTELAAGSIIGVRTWNIDSMGRLCAVNWPARQGGAWGPGVNTAHCKHGMNGCLCLDCNKDCPGIAHPDCTCGFYAYHDGISHAQNPGDVIGVVEAFGKVTIGEQGFRAEKAVIRAVELEYTVARSRFARLYPDVMIVRSWQDALEHWPLTYEYVPDPETDPEFWTGPKPEHRDPNGSLMALTGGVVPNPNASATFWFAPTTPSGVLNTYAASTRKLLEELNQATIPQRFLLGSEETAPRFWMNGLVSEPDDESQVTVAEPDDDDPLDDDEGYYR